MALTGVGVFNNFKNKTISIDRWNEQKNEKELVTIKIDELFGGDDGEVVFKELCNSIVEEIKKTTVSFDNVSTLIGNNGAPITGTLLGGKIL